MIPALREEFNRNYTPEKYGELLRCARSRQRHAHRLSRFRDAVLRSLCDHRPDGAVWP